MVHAPRGQSTRQLQFLVGMGTRTLGLSAHVSPGPAAPRSPEPHPACSSRSRPLWGKKTASASRPRDPGKGVPGVAPAAGPRRRTHPKKSELTALCRLHKHTVQPGDPPPPSSEMGTLPNNPRRRFASKPPRAGELGAGVGRRGPRGSQLAPAHWAQRADSQPPPPPRQATPGLGAPGKHS